MDPLPKLLSDKYYRFVNKELLLHSIYLLRADLLVGFTSWEMLGLKRYK